MVVVIFIWFFPFLRCPASGRASIFSDRCILIKRFASLLAE